MITSTVPRELPRQRAEQVAGRNRACRSEPLRVPPRELDRRPSDSRRRTPWPSAPRSRRRARSCRRRVARSTWTGRLPLAEPPHGLLGQELGGIARDEHAGLSDQLEPAELRVALDERDRLAGRPPLDQLLEPSASFAGDLVAWPGSSPPSTWISRSSASIRSRPFCQWSIDGGRLQRLRPPGRAAFRAFTAAHRTRWRSLHSPSMPRASDPSKPAARKPAAREAARSRGAAHPQAPTPEIRLTGDRLVVRSPENGERKSAGGLLIPATAMPAPKRLAWADVAARRPRRPRREAGRPGAVPAVVRPRGRARRRGAACCSGSATSRRWPRSRPAPSRSERPASTSEPTPAQPWHEAQPHRPPSLFSRFGSTSTTDCHVPSAGTPAEHRERERRRHEHGQQVVAAVAHATRAVRVPVVAREQALEQLLAGRPPTPIPSPSTPRPAVACGTNTCSSPSPRRPRGERLRPSSRDVDDAPDRRCRTWQVCGAHHAGERARPSRPASAASRIGVRLGGARGRRERRRRERGSLDAAIERGAALRARPSRGGCRERADHRRRRGRRTRPSPDAPR